MTVAWHTLRATGYTILYQSNLNSQFSLLNFWLRRQRWRLHSENDNLLVPDFFRSVDESNIGICCTFSHCRYVSIVCRLNQSHINSFLFFQSFVNIFLCCTRLEWYRRYVPTTYTHPTQVHNTQYPYISVYDAFNDHHKFVAFKIYQLVSLLFHHSFHLLPALWLRRRNSRAVMDGKCNSFIFFFFVKSTNEKHKNVLFRL